MHQLHGLLRVRRNGSAGAQGSSRIVCPSSAAFLPASVHSLNAPLIQNCRC